MNIFDIIGPVMIGPSSSHTAGAARIGYVARKILAQEPVEAEIGLAGSFAQTYKGHGTDRALIAGIRTMSGCPAVWNWQKNRACAFPSTRCSFPSATPTRR